MTKSGYDETRKLQKPPTDDLARSKKLKAYLGGKDNYVPCGVCGLMCPESKYEGYKGIHITCSYTEPGQRFVKAQKRAAKKELIAANKVGLF